MDVNVLTLSMLNFCQCLIKASLISSRDRTGAVWRAAGVHEIFLQLRELIRKNKLMRTWAVLKGTGDEDRGVSEVRG